MKKRYKVIKDHVFPMNSGLVRHSGGDVIDVHDYPKLLIIFLVENNFIEEVKEPEKTGLAWKPENGNVYYFVENKGFIRICQWDDDYIDLGMLDFGNVFKTETEAEAYANHRKLEVKLIRAGLEMGGREKLNKSFYKCVEIATNVSWEFILEGLYFNDYGVCKEFEQKYKKELQEWASYFISEEEK
jgi:hypothetical protein